MTNPEILELAKTCGFDEFHTRRERNVVVGSVGKTNS
jgi:hypothetical protein